MAWWCNWWSAVPYRNGLPETCRPRGLAASRPGTAHPAEAVPLAVHGAVPGTDRPVHPLLSGTVYQVRRPGLHRTRMGGAFPGAPGSF